MATKLYLIAAAAVGIVLIQEGIHQRGEELRRESPFFHVTNREMGLFLWSFPEFMRRNVPEKSGYLPHFRYIDGVTVEPEFADLLVQAPPELLRRYHEWKEKGWNVVWKRERGEKEFRLFLEEDPEWAAAEESDELQMAFVGWKNLRFEAVEIDRLVGTSEEWESFFLDYPQFREVKGKPPFLRAALFNYLAQKSSEATAKPRS